MHVQINNGVYRSGFATTQGAYERAQMDLYTALDTVEQRLSQHRFLVGDRSASLPFHGLCKQHLLPHVMPAPGSCLARHCIQGSIKGVFTLHILPGALLSLLLQKKMDVMQCRLCG